MEEAAAMAIQEHQQVFEMVIRMFRRSTSKNTFVAQKPTALDMNG